MIKYKKLLLLLIFLILIIYITDIIYINITCKKIYLTPEKYKTILIRNILTNEECDDILNLSLKYSEEKGWTTDRHGDYPTTDNEVTSSWESYPIILAMIKNILIKKIQKEYNISSNLIGLNEIFVVKYSHDKQRKLKCHEDGSEFSFIIALNSKKEYCNGGTYFVKEKKLYRLDKGDCLLFCGQNRHCGKEITCGNRFILTGFLHLFHEDYCDNLA